MAYFMLNIYKKEITVIIDKSNNLKEIIFL